VRIHLAGGIADELHLITARAALLELVVSQFSQGTLLCRSLY
jgi:hypothetical protein